MLQIYLRFAVLLSTTIFVTSDAEGSAHDVTLHHPKIELQGTGDVLDILHSQPIFPNEPVVFSVYGVRQNSSDFLTDTSYWKAITYNLRGVTLGSCFDMKKGEFVVSVPGFYEFRWEAEKGTWGLPGELYILKNDQDVFGRGFANEKTKITVRTFAQVWLNAGDRVSTRYKGQFSGGDVAIRKATNHPAFIRFSGELLVKAPIAISVPCPSGEICEYADGIRPLPVL